MNKQNIKKRSAESLVDLVIKITENADVCIAVGDINLAKMYIDTINGIVIEMVDRIKSNPSSAPSIDITIQCVKILAALQKEVR